LTFRSGLNVKEFDNLCPLFRLSYSVFRTSRPESYQDSDFQTKKTNLQSLPSNHQPLLCNYLKLRSPVFGTAFFGIIRFNGLGFAIAFVLQPRRIDLAVDQELVNGFGPIF